MNNFIAFLFSTL